jgi:hypothetical protein
MLNALRSNSFGMQKQKVESMLMINFRICMTKENNLRRRKICKRRGNMACY